MFLADDIIIQDFNNVFRGWLGSVSFSQRRFFLLFTQNIHADADAFVTNQGGWAGNQLLNFILVFAAKRTNLTEP